MNDRRRRTIRRLAALFEDVKPELEEVRDDETASLENLPESLQDGERGEKMQEAIDALDQAVDGLDELLELLETAVE